MKFECGLIRDLLPLYHDGVCSAESKRAVIDHLSECEECRKLYGDICASAEIEANSFDRTRSMQLADSYRQAKRANTKHIIKYAGLGTILLVAVSVVVTLILAGVIVLDGIFAKPEVYTDIAYYNARCYGPDAEHDYRYRLMDESIWPQMITDEMNVLEFKLVYYDPFDPQYLGYMVVDYDEASYEKEMRRLRFERQMDIKGYYGSTGFSKYDVAAMYADETGMGMVYALTDGKGRVIYVLAEFCNFFFDLKYENYVPADYLPGGFNAHEYNPYRDEWFKKVFG